MVGAASIGRLVIRRLQPKAASGNIRYRMGDSIKVILASASPRRRQLLAAAGIEFEVVESRVAEQHARGRTAARLRAPDGARKGPRGFVALPRRIVIGADTIVVCDPKFSKSPPMPPTRAGCSQCSPARTHTVVTAFALATMEKSSRASPVESRVTFRKLTMRKSTTTSRPTNRSKGRRLRNPGHRRRLHLAGRGLARQRDGTADRAVVAALARQA